MEIYITRKYNKGMKNQRKKVTEKKGQMCWWWLHQYAWILLAMLQGGDQSSQVLIIKRNTMIPYHPEP